MAFLIVLAILIAVALFVSAPLRRPPGTGEEPDRLGDRQLAELEAAREAKYREIRDAEFDHRMGKLSDADYEELDRDLRAEAIEILRALERAGAPSVEANGSSGATISSR
jgi:hypothetical protein